jgi:hypothetical protein
MTYCLENFPRKATLYRGEDMTEGDSPTAGTPRWVKVFGIIALVLVVLLVVMIIAGRGGHGPGRHTGGDIPFAGAGGHDVAAVAHTEP